MDQVRRISPEFARLFERDGIGGFIRDLVSRGFRSLFGGVMGRVRDVFNLGPIGERFQQAATWFVTIAGQLARNDCSGLNQAVARVREFMGRTFSPIADKVRDVADSISGFFGDIWDAIGAPIMGFLRDIGGAIWESIRGFISDIGGVIRRVKNALGAAWDRVKEWLGISAEEGTEEGGGLWNWIREKATAVWDRIKGPLQPIMGPLRTVGTVLVAISPVGPVLAVIHAWPYLRRAFQWVRDTWNDLNLVVRAKEFFANTVFPAVRSGVTQVGDFLVGAADWLLGVLGRVYGIVESVAGRFQGGLLAPLARVVEFISGSFRRMVEWARGGLRDAANNARSLFRRLIEFIQPIIDVLQRIIAIAVNPFGITGLLMGTLWRIIPNCIKGPVIDFIVDIIIRVLRSIPPLFSLGILWPFIRSAALGFFERVKSFATDRKVNVSNRMAEIISGQNPSFALGYLRGIGLGVWEAIVGPFIAIQQIFELPQLIQSFLRSIGLRLCDILEAIRCFAGSLASMAIGAFSGLLEAARDLIQNPGTIIEMLRCALQTALSAVGNIGSQVADQMMRLFEGPADRLGEQLGRLVGGFLVDAVLAFFTAGASTATTVINRVVGFLRTIGRNLMRVVRMIAKLIPKFLKFVRKIGGLFRRAGSRAGGLLSRVGGFFRRVARWFGKMMRRVGQRFRRRGGRGRRGRRRRDRDRGPSAAERERRKRAAIRILRARLARGIGRARLFLLMTGLRLRYRIRTLRIRRLGRRRHQLTIANSGQVQIPVHEVHVDAAPGGGHRSSLVSPGGRPPTARPHAILRHGATTLPTPTQSLAQAGYDPDDQPFSTVGRGLIDRPQWVNAQFLRWFPRGIRRPPDLGVATRKKGYFGRAEELLRRGFRRAVWNGGHLIGNQFGGPGTQWNLTPMTMGLNQRAFLSAETWLRSEWNHIRGRGASRNASASASISVSVRGYRSVYSVSKARITQLGIRERAPGTGLGVVRVHGFVPNHVTMRVRFRGRGVQGREFTRPTQRAGSGFFSRYFNRPEDALRASSINQEDDVIMRIGQPTSSAPSSQLPPDQNTPRQQRTVLRNNRTVFNFRQFRP